MTGMSKEEINLLPVRSWEGAVHLVRSLEQAEAAIERLAGEKLLGFDTETRPAFRKGQKFRPSLLQLAAATEVFLFQLQHIGLPEGVMAILGDSTIIKTGVALAQDLSSLQGLRSFTPRGFVDLGPMARQRGFRNQGLRGLAAAVCGFRITKSARTTNWANDILTAQQIRYAATDAWVGRELHQRLAALPARRNG